MIRSTAIAVSLVLLLAGCVRSVDTACASFAPITYSPTTDSPDTVHRCASTTPPGWRCASRLGPRSGGSAERWRELLDVSRAQSAGEPYQPRPQFPDREVIGLMVDRDEGGTVCLDEGDIGPFRAGVRPPKRETIAFFMIASLHDPKGWCHRGRGDRPTGASREARRVANRLYAPSWWPMRVHASPTAGPADRAASGERFVNKCPAGGGSVSAKRRSRPAFLHQCWS